MTPEPFFSYTVFVFPGLPFRPLVGALIILAASGCRRPLASALFSRCQRKELLWVAGGVDIGGALSPRAADLGERCVFPISCSFIYIYSSHLVLASERSHVYGVSMGNETTHPDAASLRVGVALK
jgi:hypothetical protein